ncbi:uncharacterized protein [Triticum aestivum]|uniref:uncharacterized protein n=1 Tax=Triticum aestivum TaxID=4565 RepID=UPI001D027DF1|nr:uncharacterized protein LOC123134135 [Triticum aestivum]
MALARSATSLLPCLPGGGYGEILLQLLPLRRCRALCPPLYVRAPAPHAPSTMDFPDDDARRAEAQSGSTRACSAALPAFPLAVWFAPTPHTHLPGDRLPAVDSSPPGPFHDGICSSLLPLRGSLVGREKDGGGYYFGGSSRRVCGGASASGYHGRFAWVLGEVQLVV